MNDSAFDSLLEFLTQIPAIENVTGTGINEAGLWWVKFKIDIKHKLVWQVVQELGHVINYVSLGERLPTVFYPVSPPPYMNGGPFDFLSWMIENKHKDFTPDDLKEWLEGRLPQPVDSESEWLTDDEDDSEPEL
ncbi:hypothetical protein [Hymenobacter yonginensis]|uniref:Uncharacterized protein n=1 Tax=Hymenobacter yonginensis TaxID=748197 RepID=A0ABY7PSM9_9BACT|nr:hypothetical protein [Hymenobacter yonginensis]WBO85848.1 hypothetical protein O9Z63_06265 [Hymenobacter yonginensis]